MKQLIHITLMLLTATTFLLQPNKGLAVPTLLKESSDQLLKDALYSNPKFVLDPALESFTGCVALNCDWEKGNRNNWFIEYQRAGGDLIQAGLVLGDQMLITRGWRQNNWGYSKQKFDNSIDLYSFGLAGTTGTEQLTSDPFHEASFFVESSGRSFLLHKQKGVIANTPATPTNVQRAAEWMMDPRIYTKGRRHDLPYTHRRWLLAAALGIAASISNDTNFQSAAKAQAEYYARKAISLQESSGIFPEKGGYDVSYQTVSLLFAARYYTVCTNTTLQRQIKNAIVKGLNWELTKIDNRGYIDLTGSTRTGVEQGLSGRTKGIDFKLLLQGLTFGTVITGDPKYRQAAERVAKYNNFICTNSSNSSWAVCHRVGK